MESIKRAIAIALTIAGVPAFAHWDGDTSADGHRYAHNGARPPYNWRLDPDDAMEDRLTQLGGPPRVRCGSMTFNGNAYVEKIDTVAAYDCSGSIPDNFAHESHCPVGQLLNDSTGACEASTNECASTTLTLRSYVAETKPSYFNHEGCMWKLVYNSANGSNWNVGYEGSGWHSSDDDGWCTSSTNAGAACSGTAIPNAPPNAVDPAEDPFAEDPDGPSGEPAGDESSCPAGVIVNTMYPGESVPSTVCLVTGCQAEPTGVNACIAASGGYPLGMCSGDLLINGERCDGSEDVNQGDMFTNGDDAGVGAGIAEVNQRLERIYQRLGTGQILDAVASAAEVAAIAAIGDQISEAIGEGGGGAGECTEGSCDGEVPTLGAGPDVAVETASFMGRIQNAPIVEAFTAIGGDIPTAECPSFTSDPIAVLDGETLTISAQCELWEDIAPILGTIMMVIYVAAGAFIILRA